MGDLDNLGWCGHKINGDNLGNSSGRTYEVKTKKPNAWGVYDIGTVWEWCSDWYSKEYYETSPASDPTRPDSGSEWGNQAGAITATRSIAGRRTATFSVRRIGIPFWASV